MFDWIDFEKHEGTWKEKDVKVLALSTCAFCSKAFEFLNSHDVEYKYVYIDTLPKKDRRRVSDEFKETFKERGLYPSVVVDNKDYQLGFIEKAWAKALGLE
ncbi:MAG TPA: glutaredoxin family protein [Sediminispirochaeta sp.]|nr:glutaredoxin family protein [Sediminispirochaeta sp.]